jgi:hypothetical protein
MAEVVYAAAAGGGRAKKYMILTTPYTEGVWIAAQRGRGQRPPARRASNTRAGVTGSRVISTP